MFIEQLIQGITSKYLDDFYLLILFVSIILMLNTTFVPKKNPFITAMGWTAIVLGLYIMTRLFYALQYTIFYSNQEFFKEHYFLYNFFYGFGIWSYLLQMLFLLIGVHGLYKGSFELKFFAGAFIYLYTSLIADYIMPLSLVAINPTIGESGYYINFEIGGGTYYPVIGIAIAAAVFFLYQFFIKKHVKTLLTAPNGLLQKLNVLPALSYVAYSFIYLMLSFVEVYPSNPGKVIYFITIFAAIILMYAIMYTAFFYGILSSIKISKVQTELEIASKIQNDNLPLLSQELIDKDVVEVSTFWQPAKEVCGDFYDYFLINQDLLAIVIADVSGKGLPAALFMMKAKTLIKDNAMNSNDVSEIFTKVNSQLYENNKMKMYATAFMGVLNLKTGEFFYSNAGHVYPIMKSKSSEFTPIKSRTGIVLGASEKAVYHTDVLHLDKGAQIFLYTDGITEAMDKKGKFYGINRLLQTLNTADNPSTVYDLINWVKDKLMEYTSNTQQADDITMMAIEYKI